MAISVPHTFIDIFTANPGDSDDLAVNKIVIPIIQRDYAQGRNNNDVYRVRQRFLNALHNALVNNSPITLDFVYGEIDANGNLIPLDGQQRLTTLFLLHWYVAKHENIEPEKCGFLSRFSYDTRASAREFCELLATYKPSFESSNLSADILDQAWFPMDWTNDPTIASMLVMIDAIHNEFKSTSGIWEKLENGAITFYFLSLKEMGLTDELYIKMNSRGKPLTQFEHFKAELEGAMKSVDKRLSEQISKKIDLAWTDMLWPYKGDNQIIDDEFIRYFHFICDIINYKNDCALISDPFQMVTALFSTANASARDNMLFVEKMFDCWCGFDIDEFFDKYLTTQGHFPQKSVVGKMANLFLDCCNVYGEMQSDHNRRFPIGRTLLLYAFILYLTNRNSITEEEFIRRLRILNNLVRASEYELRDDRMRTLLAQTEDIIVYGKLEITDKSFNINQITEEISKKDHISSVPEDEMIIREAEDHRLLNGAIRILGVDSIHMYNRFKQLFDCDWDLVDRALLSIGDYSRFINWRFQIGSSKIDSVWRDMFNTSTGDMANTKAVLASLLKKSEQFDNIILDNIIKDYLSSSPVLNWRYYLVKYESMRPGRYGMYRWPDEGKNGKVSRVILMMNTEKSTSGWNYNIFLKTLFDKLQNVYNLDLGHYAWQHDGDKLIIDGKKAISCDDSSYTIYNVLDNKTYDAERVVPIRQDDSGVNDAEDRIELGLKIIREIKSQPQDI